jgi:hypothetical protein
MAISAEVRQWISESDRFRCAYCMTQEAILGMPFEIDHIQPEAEGGTSDESNLCLACPRCNRFKGQRTHALDKVSGEFVALFNPRQQVWQEHFAWQRTGLYLSGITPTGRATIDVLQMNNPFVVHSRAVWIAWGWHPPAI